MKDVPCPTLCIHRAKWIVPGDGIVISDGAVATFGGKIVASGQAKAILLSCHGETIDHGASVLIPPLVNAHCHLELSPLKWRISPSGSFSSWVRSLVDARSRISPDEWLPAVMSAAHGLFEGGVLGIGDVGNLGIASRALKEKDFPPFSGIFYREIIQPRGGPEDLQPFETGGFPKGENGARVAISFGLSSHAVFSASSQVIIRTKAWDREHRIPFQIHTAESPEEMEFVLSGTGPILDLLKERGHRIAQEEIPGCSPIRYLHRLGVLDSNTVCVHAIHVDDDDLEILKKTGASVCLCPRSNLFLDVGIPQVERFAAAGIPFALGTDSLASNDTLSIFAEMSSLASLAPTIPPGRILTAATEHGARALGLSGPGLDAEEGRQAPIGRLDPGFRSTFLAIRADGIRDREVLEYLVQGVRGPDPVSWVGDPPRWE
ncbi:MAG: amidohydrolase family protein [Deltaproteobacteria bacterium]